MDRLEALDAWLRNALGGRAFTREPASADASFRRYFRIFTEGRTWIAMDAPPGREDCAAFVKVAALMRAAGVHVPEIVSRDLGQGFLLLSDLGTQTYLQAFAEENTEDLFRDATYTLVNWQAASREGELPPYDEGLLRRELLLFSDWYVGRHLGVALDAAAREDLEHSFGRILACNLGEPHVFVHRDFMPRNLIVSDPNPGVIDFQDAVYGPISYDIASLWRDAFVSWDEERVLDGTIRYWEAAKKRGLPVRAEFADFWRDVEWMGLQRHLKVLGIFARLHYRDRKAGYLSDTPRFINYVRHACSRYGELAPLARLLDRLEVASAAADNTK